MPATANFYFLPDIPGTNSPTYSPTVAHDDIFYFDDDDDDTLSDQLNKNLVGLEWDSVWYVLVPSLFFAVVLIAFFVSKIRKRSPFHLIYCPRYRWEREVAARSAQVGGNYTPLPRPRRQSSTLIHWFWLALRLNDATLLRHTGLEMFLMLRFIRLGLKIVIFGCCIVAPICVAAYATSDLRSDTSEYSRLAFYRFTLANVESINTGRLWVPAIMLWVVTLHVLDAVTKECMAFIELKQNFFTTVPIASDPVVSEQQLRSVVLERISLEHQTSERLFQHWDKLLPGRVHSASVCVDTRGLLKLHEEREKVALLLERLLLKREMTGQEPLIGQERCFFGCCPLPTCCTDLELRERKGMPAIPFYRSKLDELNASFKRQRDAVVAINEELRSSQAAARVSELNSSGTAESKVDEESSCARAVRIFSGRATTEDARRVLEQSSLGDAARGTTSVVVTAAQLAKKVTIGDRFCTTGFVTFKDYTSANMVRQMQLAERPHDVECLPVIADSRDIIWENVSESLDAQRARESTGSLLVYVIGLYWSFFIIFCYALANYKTLRQLGILPKFSGWYQSIVRYLLRVTPIGLISLSLALFPILLQELAEKYEHRKLRSDVQLSVLQRNFFLQIINLWVTVVTGPVWIALELIIRHPAKFFKFIGKTLPVVSVYFVELIVIKTFISLFWELARVFPWLRLRAAKLAAGGALTSRDYRDTRFLRPEMPYGSIYSTILMVLGFTMLFAVIAPLTYIFFFFFFALAYIVYTHQALHVYIPFYDSGGIFFFPVYSYLLWALIASQYIVFGFLLVKEAWSPAALTFLLPIFTYTLKNYITEEYTAPSAKPSLQRLLAVDARLVQVDSGAGRLSTDELVAKFNTNLFRQPELDETDVEPLPISYKFSEGDEDASYDDCGDDESKVEPNRATSASLQAPLVMDVRDTSYSTFAPSGRTT